jgi:UDP-N-acetylmuramoyl-L-alanyl-D-glutamate--2,6-diaminopimelate ligase
MKRAGVEWLVLETTSHGLAQNRVWGVPYSLAVMTNVTHEHLDYHGTFANYRDAKRKLFKLANGNRGGLRTGIINAEDPSAELFKSDIASSLTYGVKKGDLRATNLKQSAAGSTYTAKIGGDSYQIKCHLPGSFNVYNSLAAVAVGRVIGMDKTQIEQGIAALPSVEGRMTAVDEGQDFSVIVDYAHTPDSFEKLFSDFRPVVKGRLIVMFGSAGGQRDPAKRPIQGEIAGKYADEVVLTEEDDRDTPGQDILDQIAAGAEKAGKVREKNLFLVHDRAEAIKFTLGRAKAGDTVLLLGKGHEKNIERAHGLDHWDEIATTQKVLKILK